MGGELEGADDPLGWAMTSSLCYIGGGGGEKGVQAEGKKSQDVRGLGEHLFQPPDFTQEEK